MLPELFQIGSLTISSYSFFRILGLIAGILFFLCYIKKEKLPLIESAAFAVFGVVITILGGKLYNVGAQTIENITQGIEFFRGWANAFRSGGSFYGGLTAGSFFALWYLWKFKLPFWRIGDALAPAIAFGHFLMKIGCFMAGCCYGIPSGLPWAVRFPNLEGPRHPVQIYEALLNFTNFVILVIVWNKKRFEGQIVALYVFNYSIIHFLMQYLRENPDRVYVFKGPSVFTSLSVSQLVNLLGLAAGILLYIYLERRQRKHT
jgi:phosphatidylglycerol:prolipoprotein diacylglycerol transferase